MLTQIEVLDALLEENKELRKELEYVLRNLRACSGDYLPIKDFNSITKNAFNLINKKG